MDQLTYKKCPQCKQQLYIVKADKYLNKEQWDSIKAGDYYCIDCADNNRGKLPLCYWLESEVEVSQIERL